MLFFQLYTRRSEIGPASNAADSPKVCPDCENSAASDGLGLGNCDSTAAAASTARPNHTADDNQGKNLSLNFNF